jgi:hypothetical protein
VALTVADHFIQPRRASYGRAAPGGLWRVELLCKTGEGGKRRLVFDLVPAQAHLAHRLFVAALRVDLLGEVRVAREDIGYLARGEATVHRKFDEASNAAVALFAPIGLPSEDRGGIKGRVAVAIALIPVEGRIGIGTRRGSGGGGCGRRVMLAGERRAGAVDEVEQDRRLDHAQGLREGREAAAGDGEVAVAKMQFDRRSLAAIDRLGALRMLRSIRPVGLCPTLL